jgi:indolepyruvate ferredoxin oxidoreductase
MANAALRNNYALTDRYERTSGQVFLSGSQALVRLPLMQRQLDLEAGLNTAGFISGYTGSPLGGYDTALKQAQDALDKHHIHFQPGINEELGASAVWGSQQLDIMGEANYDGVFGLWYGKGPGVDRSGDALKHGSYAGASKHGGVLVLAGDDHGAKSSTTAHQSDQAFIHFGMPYLNPANVQEYLEFGLLGIALSRYSGCWVGMKCVTDTIESSASVSVDLDHYQAVLPQDDDTEQRNNNGPLQAKAAEIRQYQQRLPAAQAFVRANRLDKVIVGGDNKQLAIITSGKAYLDVMQAIDELGLDGEQLAIHGIGIYKVAMPWPLEPEGCLGFIAGYKKVLVIEEKRDVIESQLARLLVNCEERPQLLGKHDTQGQALVPAEGELEPFALAAIIAGQISATTQASDIDQRLQRVQQQLSKAVTPAEITRLPSFCAGCPHNTSTNVPEGSTAFGGIGCHGMASFIPERRTPMLFQMGAEGVPWIGMAPFSKREHIFQNLGDGTYYHSGLLAIRAAVAASVNITYKLLVNDAIAMTGGQAIEGKVRVDRLSQQLHAEGVRRIAVVSNDLAQYRAAGAKFADGVSLHHRDELEQVQKALRDVDGVSAIIYDQHCATELRRRRKRGLADDPSQRLFINQRVCEGCGDCSVQSNCIALEPVDTVYGRKRKINQSVCNKDYSCVKGYCPSFVSVLGGTPRKHAALATEDEQFANKIAALPVPAVAASGEPYSVLITGIGGAGVVTLGAVIGMAAFLDGKASSVLDVAGLAQRNGPVTSHIRVADDAARLHATRIARADVVLGCDIVVACSVDVLPKLVRNHSYAVINSCVAPTSDFARNPELDLTPDAMMQTLKGVLGERVDFVESSRLATTLMGNEIAANMFLVGFALQRGVLPISLDALERAIELNGVAVAMNKTALAWGRLAAIDPAYVAQAAPNQLQSRLPEARTTTQLIDHFCEELTSYQNADYANRYRQLVERVQAKEQDLSSDVLSQAVARYYFKLMAYKDEYEVARLYSDPAFKASLAAAFEGDYRLKLHLAPPALQRRDSRTKRYPKRAFGPWILSAFRVLAKLKGLRGTALDPFGLSAHRRMERQLIHRYETWIDTCLQKLSAQNYSVAVDIASLPERIRGYDTVKEESIDQVMRDAGTLLAQLDVPTHGEQRDNSIKIYEVN